MIRFIIFTMSFISILFTGCAGSCITVEGAYKEYSGGLTYCVDSTKSAEASRIVLQNENQESATLVTEAEAIAITEKLSQAAGVTAQMKASSVSNFAEFNKYLRLIMEQVNVNQIKNK